jgi:hypothetical protein
MMKNNNTLMNFFKASYDFINSHGGEENGKKQLRKLIGPEIIKKRGEYWYWGILEIKKLELCQIESLILKIERNTPPFVSDDFQIGYEGAYEKK